MTLTRHLQRAAFVPAAQISERTMTAEHKAETEESKKGKYIRRERSYGSYERTFDIAGIDTENITADYKNGILTMVLPKKKPQAPASRKLTIN